MCKPDADFISTETDFPDHNVVVVGSIDQRALRATYFLLKTY